MSSQLNARALRSSSGLEGTFRIGFGLPEEELTPTLERVGELLRVLD